MLLFNFRYSEQILKCLMLGRQARIVLRPSKQKHNGILMEYEIWTAFVVKDAFSITSTALVSN